MIDINELVRALTSKGKQYALATELLRDIQRLDKKRERNLHKLQPLFAKLSEAYPTDGPDDDLNSEFGAWLRAYRQALSQAGENITRVFGPDLEAELHKLGLQLTGHYPELHASFFTFAMDFDAYRVVIWYGPKQEHLTHCPMLADLVAKRLQNVGEGLGKGMDQDRFMAMLAEAYLAATDGKRDEESPLCVVQDKIGTIFRNSAAANQASARNFGRADFSYNLYRCAGPLVHKGWRLKVATRQFTQRRKDFLWIPDNDSGSGTVYSHIQLKGQ